MDRKTATTESTKARLYQENFFWEESHSHTRGHKATEDDRAKKQQQKAICYSKAKLQKQILASTQHYSDSLYI